MNYDNVLQIKKFHVIEQKDLNGVNGIYLSVYLTDTSGHDFSKDYWLVGDAHATNTEIVAQVTDGFNYAKVRIAIEPRRNYVWFYLPSNGGVTVFQYTDKENNL